MGTPTTGPARVMIDNAVKQWRRRLRSYVAAKSGQFEQSL